MKYDYMENLKGDIKDYIEENKKYLEGKDYNDLYDLMFLEDSITGNASGSYTFNTWKAEENLRNNENLVFEALEEFGYFSSIDSMNSCIRAIREHGSEWCDVTIRCYLLGSALSEVLEEIEWEA